MERSLGEKRRRIGDEQIDEITRLHGAFAEGEFVKIMPNEAFGYRTITVDRPLRAYWAAAPETWDGVDGDKALAKLDEHARESLLAALHAMPEQRWQTADQCVAALTAAMNGVVAKPSAALLRALVVRCIVRDPSLPEQRDAKGRIVWDPELRDTENVPLLEDVDDYLAREVLPHVPDARVADHEGKIGYEIPFTRLFYKYTAPRPSEEIKAELREREARIRQLLEEVLV